MKKIIILFGLLGLSLLLSACNFVQTEKGETHNYVDDIHMIRNTLDVFDINLSSQDILKLIQDKNFEGFSQWAHPIKGIRFTPYSYIDTGVDQVLMPKDFLDNIDDEYVRGVYDGKGDDIIFTKNGYFDTFLNSVDFLQAPDIFVNKDIHAGNMLNNLNKVYPDNDYIEYYFSGFDPKYNGMDWQSLTFVFEEYKGIQYLVGIINGSWTI